MFPLGGEPSSLVAGSAVATDVSDWLLVEVLVFLHHSSTGSSVGPAGVSGSGSWCRRLPW